MEFVGPFRLVREIGRGHNAVVYEAHDTRRDETVALKVLHLGEPDSETGQPAPQTEATLLRFVREADAIRRLQHPNIVRIRDAGTEGGRLYIAMERLHGETLRARLANGPLSPAVAAQVAQQIAGALGLAHSLGIYHRDIKPDNIFLLPDGTAKLMDFGAARIASEFSLTQTGNVIGSPAYMAPEQVVGEECDARTDVWGLGATLFECATGQKPFPGDTVTGVMYAILHKRPDFGHVPSATLAGILERTLSKRRAGRHASMAEFAADLRRVAEEAAGPTRLVGWRAGPATNATALLSRLGRRPAAALLPLAAGAAGVLTLLLLGAALLPHRASRNAAKPGPTNAMLAAQPAANQTTPTPAKPPPPVTATTPNASPLPPRQAVRPPSPAAVKNAAATKNVTLPSPALPSPALPSPALPSPALPSPVPPPARAAVLVVERSVPPRATERPLRSTDPAPPPRSVRAAPTPRRAPRAAPPRVVVAAAPSTAADPDAASSASRPLVVERPVRPGEDRPAEGVPGATPMPRLPRGLRLRAPMAEVGLRLYINADGVVERSVVTEPSGITEVDDLAQQTVLGWEFFPALRNGQPVASEQVMIVTLDRDQTPSRGRRRSGD